MEQISQHACHGGTLTYCRHVSETLGCDMRFTVYVPPHPEGEILPAVTYLAGLTCTEDNFTTKAGAYRLAAELGLMLIAPDTSPRGDDVPDDEAWDFGKGAGFYLDATESPWDRNFRMESYITGELNDLIAAHFPVDRARQGIFGHSMGGHGALTLYLRHPDLYKSVSAFAPIVAPTECPWGHKAFAGYLGENRDAWAEHDACILMRRSSRAATRPTILIDQGLDDPFLEAQLKPDLFGEACFAVGQKLNMRRHKAYDHGYFFIQSFMEDHLRHHKAILRDD
ncbi:S-formylglutathione hydrolase [Paremcibacter congregatus]|uniref:S-formylglutathione hydrolase n=1 Tax=Paremcibacter congregatus TaxID=2043170 RepID=UPI003A914489